MDEHPDARLWNNRVAALAGSTRSTPSLAISAAQAVTEAKIYGRGNEFRALDFFFKTSQALQAGTTLPEHMERFLGDGGRLAGYGRPISSTDERMPLSMSLSALLSAFAADFGWAPREFNLLMHTCFLAGMYPCYIEAADKPPGAMFPVRCPHVRYEGVARSDWPSA